MANSILAQELGSRIRELRTINNWTQKELARRIGVHKSVISYFELGERFPSYDTLLRIADVFKVSTDCLLRGGDAKQINVSELSNEQVGAIRTLIDGITKEK